MFRLDDQFLQDIGLGNLPEEQKKPFLQHIYSELELRVGTRLSDGLSDAQLQEFEEIIDRKEERIQAWLSAHTPQYASEEGFLKLQQATGFATNDPRLVAEYTATKWLEVNRPDYRDVVAAVLNELKAEIAANKDTILGSMQQPAESSVPTAPPVAPTEQPIQQTQPGQAPYNDQQQPPQAA